MPHFHHGGYPILHHFYQKLDEDTIIPRIKANFFDLKTACFYIDWDDGINSWRFIITADKDQLTYNIDRMKEFVSAFEV